MSESKNRTNPIMVIAAVSVIIFSAVGIGAMTGVIPSSISGNSDTRVADKNDAPKTASVTPEATVTAQKTKKTSVNEGAKRYANDPVRVATAAHACANCGRVETVKTVEAAGEGSGLGAVAGGVVGGILGNQVGAGTGRAVATIAGAGAGAFAGNEIEKRVKKTLRHDVVVRLEDGTTRTFSYQSMPAFRAGDKVRIVDGAIVAN